MVPIHTLWKHKQSGLLHLVVGSGASTREHEWESVEDEVITWSRPIPQATLASTHMDNGVGGFSWMGPAKDFLAQFSAIAQPPPQQP